MRRIMAIHWLQKPIPPTMAGKQEWQLGGKVSPSRTWYMIHEWELIRILLVRSTERSCRLTPRNCPVRLECFSSDSLLGAGLPEGDWHPLFSPHHDSHDFDCFRGGLLVPDHERGPGSLIIKVLSPGKKLVPDLNLLYFLLPTCSGFTKVILNILKNNLISSMVHSI